MYLYQQGVLCYQLSKPAAMICVLDVHNSSSIEYVIDIRSLIGHITDELGMLTLSNYADGILVCLFKPHGLLPQLLVVEVSTGRRLATLVLDTAHKIFVRHNSEYLLYGTHSFSGSHENRE